MKENTNEETRITQYINPINITLIEKDGLKHSNKGKFEYIIKNHSLRCENHLQIKKIIPIKKDILKFILYIFFNIITIGLINLILIWFPTLNFYLYYSKVDLKDAQVLAVFGNQGKMEIIPIKKIILPELKNTESIIKEFNLNINSQNIIMFEYKNFQYLYNEQNGLFEALDYRIMQKADTLISKCIQGLNDIEVNYMRTIFGICDIDIIVKGIFKILLIELTDPFYLFQIYSIMLWYFTDYYYYASTIVFVTVVSLVISVNETHRNLKQIQKMSKYSCPVNVYRKNEDNEIIVSKISSVDLVPGDLYEIPEDGLSMPCDTIIIKGSVIVNESMLTGESTPITKLFLSNNDILYDTTTVESDKHIFFCGTKIVQKRSLKNQKTMGIVYETGFKTFKGNLISNILFPKEQEEQFTKDSIKYIIFMTILCFFGYGIAFKFLQDADLSDHELLMRFLDLFTTAVPPALPACLSIGITYSLRRLKEKNIFCLSRDRINIAGGVNMIIFDKTGTLTEDYLDISGYVPIKINSMNQKFEFDNYRTNMEKYSDEAVEHFKKKVKKNNYFNKNKDIRQLYVECLACCHCLTRVNGKLIGDPLDLKMFEGINWIMKENENQNKSSDINIENNPNEINTNENKINQSNNTEYDPIILAYIRPKTEKDSNITIQNEKEEENIFLEKYKNRYEIAVVRRFDFVSKLQRMTVICKNINENYFKAFCKGSPEKIKKLCRPETIPSQFNNILNSYASKGFRVLALAARNLKIDFIQSQKIKREQIEKNMIFLGLLIVRNKLKDATPPTILTLDNADLRMVMATGDNILTAISVSKECNLVKYNQKIYSCEINDNKEGKEILKWKKISDNEFNLEDLNKDYNNNNINNNISNTKEQIQMKDFNENIDNNLSFYNEKKENSFYIEEDISKKVLGHDYINPKSPWLDDLNNDVGLISIYPPEKENIEDILIQPNFSEENTLEDSNKNLEIKQEKTLGRSSFSIFDKDNLNIEIDEENSPFLYEQNTENLAIAITGETFEKIYSLHKKYKEDKNSNKNFLEFHKIFRLILRYGIIFARMAPEQKSILVQSFKDEGLTTLMCGDGANDCAALRTANVGVSLSQEEASIAAHFTSKTPDISCLFNLLREGKCSLATCIQTFKYMMLYSIIQFIEVTLDMIYMTYLSDFQFLISDLFIVFPLEWFLAFTRPYDQLTYHYPDLGILTLPVLTSILSHTLFTFVFQYFGYNFIKHFYKWENRCDFTEEDEDPLPCEENTIIFLIAHFQYLFAALSFSVSKPFKQKITSNIYLVLYLVLSIGYSIWITLFCDSVSKDLFTLFDFEKDSEEEDYARHDSDKIKYLIILIIALNSTISIAFEWIFILFLGNWWEKRNIRKYMEEIENEKKGDDALENEIEIFKYQRVYYYEKRFGIMETKRKIINNGNIELG